jgi:hypothetical protein
LRGHRLVGIGGLGGNLGLREVRRDEEKRQRAAERLNGSLHA